MQNQSEELLCIYVSFKESRDSIKEELETNKWHVFIIVKKILNQFKF